MTYYRCSLGLAQLFIDCKQQKSGGGGGGGGVVTHHRCSYPAFHRLQATKVRRGGGGGGGGDILPLFLGLAQLFIDCKRQKSGGGGGGGGGGGSRNKATNTQHISMHNSAYKLFQDYGLRIHRIHRIHRPPASTKNTVFIAIYPYTHINDKPTKFTVVQYNLRAILGNKPQCWVIITKDDTRKRLLCTSTQCNMRPSTPLKHAHNHNIWSIPIGRISHMTLHQSGTHVCKQVNVEHCGVGVSKVYSNE